MRYGAAPASRAWSSSPPSAPASARRWSSTAGSCRTPSSGTSRSTGHDVEQWAASSSAKREDLSCTEWAERLTVYYRTLEKLFSPELFVVGGGVSKHGDQFLPLIDIKTPIVAAQLRNRAGIVGAALYAAGNGE